MRNLMSTGIAFVTSKLGRCATCMRQSLIAATSAWVVFAIGLALGLNGLALGFLGASAVALSGLWLTHVAAYATRAVREPRRDALRLVAASTPTERDAEAIGRRRAIGTLLRAAGAGALASIPVVLWSSESHAFCGQCTQNADCGVGFVCRNTAPVNSGRVCNECVKS